MTISIKAVERLDLIQKLLDERASQPEPPYWFHSEGETGYSEGESFCLDCIRALVPHAQIGVHYGGGYCCEADGCEFCERCGKLLQYDLTDYGVGEELAHFTMYPPANLDDPDECYHLAQVVGGLYTDLQKRTFLKIMRRCKWVETAE